MTSLHPLLTGARLSSAVALACLLLLQQPHALAAQPAAGESIQAQPAGTDALAARVRERFDVVPLQDGIGLVPKQSSAGVRIIELRHGTIALNGEVVTGRELVDRLGDTADSILQLSYLDEATLRKTLGMTSGEIGTPPSAGTEPAAPAAPRSEGAAEPSVPRPREREDVVRIGGSVSIDRDEIVKGDVVVIGGEADINGEVTGDLVVIASALNLGPDADVHGDATIVASHKTQSPGARVRGRVHDVATGWRDWHGGPERFAAPWAPFMRFGGFILTMLRLGLLLVAAWIVMMIAPDLATRISGRAAAEPVKAGVIGLLGELLVFPVLILVIVILAISIIGIPLLLLVPFALLGLVLVFVLGFSSVAGGVGGWLVHRFGWTLTPLGAVALGVVALLAPACLARVMYLFGGPFNVLGILFSITAAVVEFVAWTVGFGAAILTRFDSHRAPAVAQTAA